MRRLIDFIASLFNPLIGRFRWTSPPWLRFLNTARKNSPARFWLTLLAILLAGGGYLYVESLPKPEMVKAFAQAPAITQNVKDAKPYPLRITFKKDGALTSVAALETLDKELNDRIAVAPVAKGRWSWQSENTLLFTPENDWPAGQEYSVTFAKDLFSKSVKLEEYSSTFTTPPFTVSVESFSFYKDPADPTIRKVVGTLSFSHPVDSKSLESKLSMSLQSKAAGDTGSGKPYTYTVTYDDNHRQAFIHSEPVNIGSEENYMYLKVAGGIKPLHGPARTESELSDKVVIPSSYTFFRIRSANGQIVRDEQNDNQPDQALVIEFTDGVMTEKITDNIKAFLLPLKRFEKEKSPEVYSWRSPAEVTEEVLSRATPLALEALPTERRFESIQSFRFNAPENRYLYVRIGKGVKSEGGFSLAMDAPQLVRVPEYPKEAKIAFDGSLISAASEKKLTLLSRGLEALKIEIGQLLPGQINHLVSQTSGDIRNPDFNARWNFNEENISTIHTEILPLNVTHPGKAVYSVVDLAAQLKKSGQKAGVFFVQVDGWDQKNKREVYGASDKRMIMVTDLGILVKDSADRSHDVFVQSVKQGTPVAGATVEVLGKNGVPVLTETTDEQGHVSFPKLEDFKGAQAPVAYLIRKGGDTSFLPFGRSDRMLNYSRFDIGGVQTRYQQKDGLNAYLFSDRGIYRPGDKVHLAAIVRQRSWEPLGPIPLQLFVNDARGNNVLSKKIELPPAGFFDWELATEYTSATGQYTATVYLIKKDGGMAGMIGSTHFKVEEFQPDSMKISTMITGDRHKGWYGPDEMMAHVKLENLFGTPAQDRKVEAGINLAPAGFVFSQFKGFSFADPLPDQEKRLIISESLPSAKTDKDGRAEFALNLKRYNQGTYRLSFDAKGFEAGGGRSVASASSVLVSPVSHLVGFKPDGNLAFVNKGSDRSVELLAIDPDLEQINLGGLTRNIIERRHVSTLIKQKDGTFKYQSILKESTLSSEPFEIPAKGMKLKLDSSEPGDFVVEIADNTGQKLGRIFYSVAGAGNLTRSLEKNAELKVKLDKTSYDAGQSISVHITAPYTGAGLITIERDKVFAYKWFRTNQTSTVEKIRIPREMEGNGYVNVTFIRAADSREIYTSPLSYSAIPFSVGRERREIRIDLDAPEMVKPGDMLKLNYKASKPSRIAIIAVDEGILQVAKYQTPDPLSHFLKKQALEVSTFQIADLILPEYKLAMELAAAGGGAMRAKTLGANLNPFRRLTDAPVAFWSGIMDADDKDRSYSFEVPDYFNGSLRLMAVAVSQEAIGVVRKDTTVKGPFVLSPNAPLMAAPDDEFDVTVGIANNLEGSGDKAEIAVSMELSSHLTPVGESSKTVVIGEGNEGRVVFRVKAGHELGSASMKFVTSIGDHSSRRTTTLSVRPAVPHMATFVSDYRESGGAEVTIDRKLLPDLAEQVASGSHSPLVMVEGLGSYLKNFAHGCAEQMVSKVFPYLGLLSHPGYNVDAQKVRRDFDTVIMTLRSRQTAQGGFRFWPGQSVAQGIDFPSVYITHFLTDAKELDYPVPAGMLKRGLDYLMAIARNRSDTMEEARVRAYAIYILTRNQVVTSNYLIDLKTELEKQYKQEWLNDITAVYMAASFQMLKNGKLAKELMDGYEIGGAKSYLTSDFDGKLNQDAQYIYLLARHFSEQFEGRVGGKALKAVIEPLNRGEYNTLSASYSMLALGAYTRHIKGAADDSGISIGSVTADGTAVSLKTEHAPFARASFPVDAQKIRFSDAGDHLFYVVSQAGFEQELPKKEIHEGLEIFRQYYDREGKEIASAPIGSEVEVRIRVRTLNGSDATNVAIIDLLPAGFEIVRDSFSDKNGVRSWRSYKDIREDRIVIYGDFSSSVTQYSYKAKVTASGDFVVPPVYAESMYNRRLHARSLAGRFRVEAGQ